MSRKLQRKKKRDRTQYILALLLIVIFVFTFLILIIHVPAQNKVSSILKNENTETVAKQQILYKKPLSPASETPLGPSFYLFIVLDDAGAAVEQLYPFYAFPEFEKLTFAILPHLSDTQKVIQALADKNTSYMLHMPMQPFGAQDPGPLALHVNYSKEKIAELTVRNIEDIPDLIGVNNHMGSAATTNDELMRTLLMHIKDQGLFFMDSRTSENSVASEVATHVGVPFIIRDIFLDNREDVDHIKGQLQKAVVLARSRGFAIAIGHVTKKETARALISAYENMKAQGVLFASLRKYFLYVR